MSRISNSKYIKNDISKIKKSLEAISYMNEIYIQSHLSNNLGLEKLNINSKITDNLFEKILILMKVLFIRWMPRMVSHMMIEDFTMTQ